MKKIICTAILIACFSLIITAQNNSKTIQKANNYVSIALDIFDDAIA